MNVGPTGPSLIAAASLQAKLPQVSTVPPAETRPQDGVRTPGAPAATGGGPRLAPETARAAQEQGSKEGRPDPAAAAKETGADGLTPAEERQVQALKQRDAEVRRHEQAHAAAGGAYAGAPQYEYTTGPDGRRYAIGGSVSIDAGAVPGDPEATIEKLRTVKRAALAPGEPSAQDRRVAAQAELGIAEARTELREERAEEAKEKAEASAAPGTASAAGGTGKPETELPPEGAAARGAVLDVMT